jgi:hypothetical protein
MFEFLKDLFFPKEREVPDVDGYGYLADVEEEDEEEEEVDLFGEPLDNYPYPCLSNIKYYF